MAFCRVRVLLFAVFLSLLLEGSSAAAALGRRSLISECSRSETWNRWGHAICSGLAYTLLCCLGPVGQSLSRIEGP